MSRIAEEADFPDNNPPPIILEEDDEGGESKASPSRPRAAPSLLASLRNKAESPDETLIKYNNGYTRLQKVISQNQSRILDGNCYPSDSTRSSRGLNPSKRQSQSQNRCPAPHPGGTARTSQHSQAGSNNISRFASRKRSASDLKSAVDLSRRSLSTNRELDAKHLGMSTVRKKRYVRESNKENARSSLHMNADPVCAPGRETAVASSPNAKDDLQLPYMTLMSLRDKQGRKNGNGLPLIERTAAKNRCFSDLYRQNVAKMTGSRRKRRNAGKNCSVSSVQRAARAECSTMASTASLMRQSRTEQKAPFQTGKASKTDEKGRKTETDRGFYPGEDFIGGLYNVLRVNREEQIILVPRLAEGDIMPLQFALAQIQPFQVFEPELEFFPSLMQNHPVTIIE